MNRFIESFRKDVKEVLGEDFDYSFTDPKIYNMIDDQDKNVEDEEFGLLDDDDMEILKYYKTIKSKGDSK